MGRRIAQSVARATHVPRLCNGPGFDSRPGSLCCVSLPISYPVSCPTLQAVLSNKARKAKKYLKKKKKERMIDDRNITWTFNEVGVYVRYIDLTLMAIGT